VPDEWAQGLADVIGTERLQGFTSRQWADLIEDGRRFLERWGADAARLGWTAVDLFGVHPVQPWARYDCMGLVPLIWAGEVVALDATRATIQMVTGGPITYLRKARPGAVAIWECLP
jgi:hypothetical protein